MSENTETTVQQLADIKYPLVAVPFHGQPIFVRLRELTQAQLAACGDFSLIVTEEDKGRKSSPDDVIEYAKLQAEIVSRSLVSPTYDEIIAMFDSDERVKSDRAELIKLEEKLHTAKPSRERQQLQDEINALMVWTDILLPHDFTGSIMSYALGNDKSDIKEISADMLLDAAVLAERGHDNPADHLSGNFTDFNREDINRRAWIELNEHRKKNPPKKVKR